MQHIRFYIRVFLFACSLTRVAAQADTTLNATDLAAQAFLLHDAPRLEMPGKDSTADATVIQMVDMLHNFYPSAVQLLTKQATAAAINQQIASEALQLTKADTLASKATIALLKKDEKSAKAKAATLKKMQDRAVATTELVAMAVVGDIPMQRKNLPKIIKQTKSLGADYQAFVMPESKPETKAPVVEKAPEPPAEVVQVPPPSDTATTQEGEKKQRSKVKIPKIGLPEKAPKQVEPSARFTAYDPAQDVMITPPMPNCKLAVERRDEFSGSVYKATDYQELFRFTNVVMKKVLPEGQPHIICTAAVATDGPGGLLLLQFLIKDANARRTFGNLAKGSQATLKFIDGDMITLFNTQSEEGQFDPEAGTAIYRAKYAFDRSLFKKWEKTELDQVRIAWSTGYEDYSVQAVDALMRLVRCVK